MNPAWAQGPLAHVPVVPLPQPVRDALELDLDVSPLDFPDLGSAPKFRNRPAADRPDELLPVRSWPDYDAARWWKEHGGVLRDAMTMPAPDRCKRCRCRVPASGDVCEACHVNMRTARRRFRARHRR